MGRRGRGVAGLSLAASAGLLGAYIGYPGLRKANAATSCTVTLTSDTPSPHDPPDPNDYVTGELRYCLNQVHDNGGGTITFAESANGTIKLDDDLPFVTVSSSVTITGNGAGNTVIDGYNNNYAVFAFDGSGTASISGVKIQNAHAEEGGAVYAYGVEVSVSDSVFDSNVGYSGGAIYVDGTLTVTGSTFTSNKGDEGGAVYVFGELSVSSSSFNSNNSEFGGAVYVSNATQSASLTVSGSTFTDNYANATGVGRVEGGAIFVDGSAQLSDSRFDSNLVLSDTSFGGAVFTTGDVTATRTTLESNSAVDGAGGAIYALGNVILRQSTFSNNVGAPSAVGTTGTLFSQNCTFTLNDSNATIDGSTLYSVGDMTLDFTTIAGNTLGDSFPAARTDTGAVGVTNSVFWDNYVTGFDTVYDIASAGQLSASHSLFSASSSVSPTVSGDTLIFGEDPLLGSLANNGGPTQTMMPGAGSPVLGAANPAGAPATDQRGYTRTTNGRADMGAVERLGVPPAADPSQVPPSWHQAQGREQREAVCPPGMAPSWAQWPNERTGGWTCEYTTWWDVNEGVGGGWVTTPGFRAGSMRGR